MPPLINIEIITQEGPVFKGDATAVTAPASLGEVTILPNHIPLFTKLDPGELKIFNKGRWQILATAGGFMDVAPKGEITILADSAVRIEEINVARAEAAKRKAQEALKQKLSHKDFALAEADLRKAVLELKVARKHRGRKPSQQ